VVLDEKLRSALREIVHETIGEEVNFEDKENYDTVLDDLRKFNDENTLSLRSKHEQTITHHLDVLNEALIPIVEQFTKDVVAGLRGTSAGFETDLRFSIQGLCKTDEHFTFLQKKCLEFNKENGLLRKTISALESRLDARAKTIDRLRESLYKELVSLRTRITKKIEWATEFSQSSIGLNEDIISLLNWQGDFDKATIEDDVKRKAKNKNISPELFRQVVDRYEFRLTKIQMEHEQQLAVHAKEIEDMKHNAEMVQKKLEYKMNNLQASESKTFEDIKIQLTLREEELKVLRKRLEEVTEEKTNAELEMRRIRNGMLSADYVRNASQGDKYDVQYMIQREAQEIEQQKKQAEDERKKAMQEQIQQEVVNNLMGHSSASRSPSRVMVDQDRRYGDEGVGSPASSLASSSNPGTPSALKTPSFAVTVSSPSEGNAVSPTNNNGGAARTRARSKSVMAAPQSKSPVLDAIAKRVRQVSPKATREAEELSKQEAIVNELLQQHEQSLLAVPSPIPSKDANASLHLVDLSVPMGNHSPHPGKKSHHHRQSSSDHSTTAHSPLHGGHSHTNSHSHSHSHSPNHSPSPSNATTSLAASPSLSHSYAPLSPGRQPSETTSRMVQTDPTIFAASRPTTSHAKIQTDDTTLSATPKAVVRGDRASSLSNNFGISTGVQTHWNALNLKHALWKNYGRSQLPASVREAQESGRKEAQREAYEAALTSYRRDSAALAGGTGRSAASPHHLDANGGTTDVHGLMESYLDWMEGELQTESRRTGRRTSSPIGDGMSGRLSRNSRTSSRRSSGAYLIDSGPESEECEDFDEEHEHLVSMSKDEITFLQQKRAKELLEKLHARDGSDFTHDLRLSLERVLASQGFLDEESSRYRMDGIMKPIPNSELPPRSVIASATSSRRASRPQSAARSSSPPGSEHFLFDSMDDDGFNASSHGHLSAWAEDGEKHPRTHGYSARGSASSHNSNDSARPKTAPAEATKALAATNAENEEADREVIHVTSASMGIASPSSEAFGRMKHALQFGLNTPQDSLKPVLRSRPHSAMVTPTQTSTVKQNVSWEQHAYLSASGEKDKMRQSQSHTQSFNLPEDEEEGVAMQIAFYNGSQSASDRKNRPRTAATSSPSMQGRFTPLTRIEETIRTERELRRQTTVSSVRRMQDEKKRTIAAKSLPPTAPSPLTVQRPLSSRK
jgi:hypothetical protein